MAYGTLKVDNIIFTNGGVDQTITVSGIVASTSGNLTVTGTISGDVIRGGTTVSGATVTGAVGQFGNLTAVSGTFTTISGGTQTVTSGVFASGTAANPSISFIGDVDTGIYSSAANEVAISTNGSGRLFVDASGRVLVGTSTARGNFFNTTGQETVFQIEGTSNNNSRVSFTRNSADDNSSLLLFGKTRSASVGGNTVVQNNDSLGGFSFLGSDGTELVQAANIVAFVDGTPGADDMPGRIVFSTTPDGSASPTERMRLDSSGRLGLGTSSPGAKLEIYTTGTYGTAYQPAVYITNSSSGGTLSANTGLGAIAWATDSNSTITSSIEAIRENPSSGAASALVLRTGSSGGGTERLRITSGGNVGIGTTSPNATVLLDVRGDAVVGTASVASRLKLARPSDGAVGAYVGYLTTSNSDLALANDSGNGNVTLQANSGNIIFNSASSTERARIDSSGRLLVGTSTARANYYNGTGSAWLQVEGDTFSESSISITCNNNAGNFLINRSNGASVNSNTLVASDNVIGGIVWQGNDGTEFVELATIKAAVDGTPGANDMPGRLVFATTADGASSPTERMRITSDGEVLIAKTVSDLDTAGVRIKEYINISRASGVPLSINRLTNDGGLIDFFQAGTLEGSISVSGTTVTYGGGHLARWSQLPNDEDPSSILKGTLMSNLDEMCEWGDEDNEQLNKTKVSDVEGDPNVAGVFVSTSFSDDGPLDFFCAMTGDMIIRIAQGVTVQRGDLLMSAGDGTAKPQDDDIIRSKTVAKVTSTHVTCTYDDGSYCVPCVLMAC
jgi:hypothetical protein